MKPVDMDFALLVNSVKFWTKNMILRYCFQSITEIIKY
jgi:hypothetical protein